MLRKLLKMFFGHRAKPELEFLPIRAIPMSSTSDRPRTEHRSHATVSPSHGHHGWGKSRSNQLSS